MRNSLAAAAALLALAMPTYLSAQDAAEGTEPETGAEQAPADTTSPGAGDLSLGTPEGSEPALGQTYVRDTFSDWEVRCVRTESDTDPCQLYQLLFDENDNAVAEINIFGLPEGQEATAGATVITPLETLLTAQIRLAVDGGQARRYPFSFCTQIGCYARLGFTDTEIEEFKRGVAATVTIVSAAQPDQPVDLSVSLSGFTAAWTALTEGE